MDNTRDLGVVISADFRATMQNSESIEKANRVLHQLRREVVSRKPEVLIPLYEAYVRPHLEYCTRA